MKKSGMYHAGSRGLQERFDSVRLADRLEQITVHEAFTEDDTRFIEKSPFFFLATADAEGAPDCSHKGGLPGFVRVVGASELVFPDYDGNGMFKSLGNIMVNPQVGLLFIRMDRPGRIRVNGTASVHWDDSLMAEFPGATLLVRVKAKKIFPNCPRYIHPQEMAGHSPHPPRPDYQPPDAEWKEMEVFRDHLPGKGTPEQD